MLLYDEELFLIAETVTDSRGVYRFEDLQPFHTYTVLQDSIPDLYDVSANEHTIVADLPGERYRFDVVDAPGKTIRGTVKEDVDQNGAGDVGLEGIILQLFDRRDDSLVTTTVTDANGRFEFRNVDPAGIYSVQEVLPEGFINVKDKVQEPSKQECPHKKKKKGYRPHDHDQQDSGSDPDGANLRKDGVWYEIELTVWSMDGIECSINEWKNVKNFLEKELRRIKLYKRFGITDLNPRLCAKRSQHQNNGKRRLLSNGFDPMQPSEKDDYHRLQQEYDFEYRDEFQQLMMGYDPKYGGLSPDGRQSAPLSSTQSSIP